MQQTLLSKLAKNPQLLITLFGFIMINIAIGSVAYFYSQKSESLLYDQTFRQLRTIADFKHHKLGLFFAYRKADIQALAASETVVNLTQRLAAYDASAADTPSGGQHFHHAENVQEQYRRYLQSFLNEYVYTSVMLVDTAHGHIMFSTHAQLPVNTDLGYGPLKDTPLARLWRDVKERNATQIGDIHFYPDYDKVPSMFLGTPVFIEGKTAAVLILQLPGNAVNEIMHFRSGMGKSGESYAVGEDHLMRSDSYLDPARLSVTHCFVHPESGCVQTAAVERALAGKTGRGVSADYRGVPVLTAYRPFAMPDFTWAIISKIDQSELTDQIDNVQRSVYLLALIVSLVITGFAYFIIRAIIRISVVRPIEQSYRRARGFENILEKSLNEIYIFEKESLHFVYANRGALRNTGYTLDELCTMTPLHLKPEFDAPRFRQMIAPLLGGEKEQLVFETLHERRDGSRYDVVVRLQLMQLEEEEAFVAFINDITERKRAQKEKEHFYRLSSHDHLTQIYNRQKFDELSEMELERSRRYHGSLALILFDIDHFKEVNDSRGHHVGDIVLQRLSHYVREALRESDIFARWGGEEFVILIPHVTLETAREKAEDLRHGIETLSIEEADGVTCSFGVTMVDPYAPMSESFQKADTALYRAKSEGRNRVCTE